MTTVRTPKASDRRGFSMPRSTAQHGKRNNGISFEARGVLAYLLSKPDDWDIQIADLMAEGGIGRDKAKNILKELRSAGYIVTEMSHGERGKFTGKTERLHESIHRDTENQYYGDIPITENPSPLHRSTEKPLDGKTVGRQIHPIHNTDKIQNTDKRVAPAKADAAPLDLTPEQLFNDAIARAAHLPTPPASSNAVAKVLALPANGKKPGRPNPHFDAIVEAFGVDPDTLTKTENGGIGKVANELKAAGYTPEDIGQIHAYCIRQNFASFTWHALTAHASKWRATQASAPRMANGSPRRDPDKFLGGMDDTYWETYTGPEPSRHD